MKSPAVLLIGKTRAEATLASAALYCAGARIVTSKPDLALVVEAKATSELPKKLDVPVVAIVRPGQKRRALMAGADAAYTRPGYEPVTLVTRDGQRIRGVRKNEDEFSIQIMDMRQRLQGYLKANLADIVDEQQSVMPAFGADRLSDGDLDDLLAYLHTLRGS